MDLTKDNDNPQAVHGLINPDLKQGDAFSPVFFILLKIMPSGVSKGIRSCWN
jgi:hypothetical protein